MMVLVQQETVFAIEIREGVEARKKLLLFSFRQKISSHFCLCVKLKTCVTIQDILKDKKKQNIPQVQIIKINKQNIQLHYTPP
jgi:hypothetical protein